jgi:methionyl aminopeptidase
MIYLKNREEIEVISQGAKILADILKHILSLVKPGASTAYIEKIAEEMIIEAGGRPAFKNYPLGGGIFFPSTVCASINNEVVHGSTLPDRLIKAGDIVDLDIGMEWPISQDIRDKYNLVKNKHSKLGGFYTDTCATVGAGKTAKSALKLMKVCQESLDKAISLVKPGVYLNEIGMVIERKAKEAGYSVVKDFVGHGLGYFAHEAPDIYNYNIGRNSSSNIKLEEGMVIAIEPMINLGAEDIKIADNGYTVLTEDDSLSAHFEHTIAVLEKGAKVLTLR